MEASTSYQGEIEAVLNMAENTIDMQKQQLSSERHKYKELVDLYESKNVSYVELYEENRKLMYLTQSYEAKIKGYEKQLDESKKKSDYMMNNCSNFINNTLNDIKKQNEQYEDKIFENSLLMKENLSQNQSLSKIKILHKCDKSNIEFYQETLKNQNTYINQTKKESNKRIEEHLDTLSELLEKYSTVNSENNVLVTKNDSFGVYITNIEKSYNAKIEFQQSHIKSLVENFIKSRSELFDERLKNIKLSEKNDELEEDAKVYIDFIKKNKLNPPIFKPDMLNAKENNETNAIKNDLVDGNLESVEDKEGSSLIENEKVLKDFLNTQSNISELSDSKDSLELFMKNFVKISKRFEHLEDEVSLKKKELDLTEVRIKNLNEQVKKKINYELQSKKETAFKVEQENIKLNSLVKKNNQTNESLENQIVFLKKSKDHSNHLLHTYSSQNKVLTFLNEKLKKKINQLDPQINLAYWTLPYAMKTAKFRFDSNSLYSNIDELSNLKEKFEKENNDLTDKINDLNRILNQKESKNIQLGRTVSDMESRIEKYQSKEELQSNYNRENGKRGYQTHDDFGGLFQMEHQEVRTTLHDENNNLKEKLKSYFKEINVMNNKLADSKLKESLTESKLTSMTQDYKKLSEYILHLNNEKSKLEMVELKRQQSDIETQVRERDYFKSSYETVDNLNNRQKEHLEAFFCEISCSDQTLLTIKSLLENFYKSCKNMTNTLRKDISNSKDGSSLAYENDCLKYELNLKQKIFESKENLAKFKVDNYEFVIKQLTQRCNLYNTVVQEYIEKVKELQEQQEKLEANSTQEMLKNYLQQKKDEYNGLQDAFNLSQSNLKNQNANLEDRLAEMVNNVCETKNKTEETFTEIKTSVEQKFEEMQKQNKIALDTLVLNTDELISKKEKEIEALRKDFTDNEWVAKEKMDGDIQGLETELQKVKNLREESQARLVMQNQTMDLLVEISNKKMSKNELGLKEKELQDSTNKMLGLDNEISDQKSKIVDQEAQISEINAKNEDQQKASNQFVEKNENLEKQNSNLQIEVTDLRKTIKDLEQNQADLQEKDLLVQKYDSIVENKQNLSNLCTNQNTVPNQLSNLSNTENLGQNQTQETNQQQDLQQDEEILQENVEQNSQRVEQEVEKADSKQENLMDIENLDNTNNLNKDTQDSGDVQKCQNLIENELEIKQEGPTKESDLENIAKEAQLYVSNQNQDNLVELNSNNLGEDLQEQEKNEIIETPKNKSGVLMDSDDHDSGEQTAKSKLLDKNIDLKDYDYTYKSPTPADNKIDTSINQTAIVLDPTALIPESFIKSHQETEHRPEVEVTQIIQTTTENEVQNQIPTENQENNSEDQNEMQDPTEVNESIQNNNELNEEQESEIDEGEYDEGDYDEGEEDGAIIGEIDDINDNQDNYDPANDSAENSQKNEQKD